MTTTNGLSPATRNGQLPKPVLRTRDLTLRFGGIAALDEVDIEIRPREILGLLGPNGAGKSTLFNVIGGFLKPDHGRVLFQEDDITYLLPYERVAAGIGRTFQHVRLFRNLTVYENLLVAQHRHLTSGSFAAMLRLPSWRRDERVARERVETILDQVNLRPWRDARPTEISYGTTRFLELACVLSLDPKVLLLDEPASGIQQKEVEALGPMLKRIRDERGCSIMLIEHDMGLLLGTSERIYALDFGKVIAEGRPDEVTSNDRVLESYLGRTRRDTSVA
ncbi:MAG TPA: ABC transporter ATP-binding protein [Actinomycetota bacterium]|nr:ABC transporter ATP-binding protein [Actinomycetota bacterium]